MGSGKGDWKHEKVRNLTQTNLSPLLCNMSPLLCNTWQLTCDCRIRIKEHRTQKRVEKLFNMKLGTTGRSKTGNEASPSGQ